MSFIALMSVPISHALARAAWPALAVGSVAVMGVIQLVERRGKEKSELNPHRQIEIGTVIESMPEAVFIFDTAGSVMEANSAAERVFRATRDVIRSFVADDIAEFLAKPGEPAQDADRIVTRALSGETIDQERRSVTLKSQSRSIETVVSASPIRDAAGAVVGALIIVRDVTELTVLQQRMSDAERHTAIGKMTAGLAHDFNNVLDTISQAVSVMEIDPNRPQEERQLVTRMIRNAVKRGAEIIGGVRRFLVSGNQECELVDLNEVLEEAVELTRPLWQAIRTISVTRKFQPVHRVYANSSELRRVFTNLVINAIEAMPSGGDLIVGCEQKGNRIRAYVADTGEGIPEEKKRHIFSPYYTTKEQGTGLGLSTAERSVRAQRGSISFESKEGEGTRFCIDFPAAEFRDEESKSA